MQKFIETEIGLLGEIREFAIKSSGRLIWQYWSSYKLKLAEADKAKLVAIMKKEQLKRAHHKAKVSLLARKAEKTTPLPKSVKAIAPTLVEKLNEPNGILLKNFAVKTFELHSFQVPLNRNCNSAKFRRASDLLTIENAVQSYDDTQTGLRYIQIQAQNVPKKKTVQKRTRRQKRTT